MDEILHQRIAALRADHDNARIALERATASYMPPIVIGEEKIAAFGVLMRERLTTGEIPFRKAYLSAIIDKVEVGEGQIRILGRKEVLQQACLGPNQGGEPGVRSFVRRWRSLRESNPSFKIENLAS